MEGSIAGPKVLEHIVDTVLQFEGDQHYMYRILRSIKNRFGSTAEPVSYTHLDLYKRQQKGEDTRTEEQKLELPITHMPARYLLPLTAVFIAALLGIAWILIKMCIRDSCSTAYNQTRSFHKCHSPSPRQRVTSLKQLTSF